MPMAPPPAGGVVYMQQPTQPGVVYVQQPQPTYIVEQQQGIGGIGAGFLAGMALEGALMGGAPVR